MLYASRKYLCVWVQQGATSILHLMVQNPRASVVGAAVRFLSTAAPTALLAALFHSFIW